MEVTANFELSSIRVFDSSNRLEGGGLITKNIRSFKMLSDKR